MSHSQFHSTSLLILRHAWLNLWDKRMTTGRINQVNIFRCRITAYATHPSAKPYHTINFRSSWIKPYTLLERQELNWLCFNLGANNSMNHSQRKRKQLMKLTNTAISHHVYQSHSLQFYSTKLNEFSQNFNATTYPTHPHTIRVSTQNPKIKRKQLNGTEWRKKFTIKNYGVSFKQIATQKLKSLPEKNKLISPDTRTISKRTITHCFHRRIKQPRLLNCNLLSQENRAHKDRTMYQNRNSVNYHI